EPARLMQWWGPKGFTMKAAQVDFRPGGTFLYGMTGPGMAGEIWGKFVYREIDAPRRLTFVSSFTDEKGNITRHPMAPTWPLETLSTLTFVARGDKTVIIGQAKPVNATAEEEATFGQMEDQVKAGFAATMDQLEEYLRTAA